MYMLKGLLMKDKVTILTTTHFEASAHRISKDYPGNHDRKYTHTNLIKGVMNGLYEKIGTNDLRHIISLDHNPDSKGSNEYLDNLNKLSEEYENLEIITTTDGIYHSIKNLTHSVETDYYLWFEHDWQFNEEIDLSKFVEIMEKYNHINYIRFNKRANVSTGSWGDKALWESPEIPEMNLIKTTQWSNNPYFGRASKMKDWYKVLDEKISDGVDFHPTIELQLTRMYESHIHQYGIESANKEWGIFIYGKMGESARVHHLNGKDL